MSSASPSNIPLLLSIIQCHDAFIAIETGVILGEIRWLHFADLKFKKALMMGGYIEVEINHIALVEGSRDNSRATKSSVPFVISRTRLSVIVAANSTFIAVINLCLKTPTKELIIIPVWGNKRLINIRVIGLNNSFIKNLS